MPLRPARFDAARDYKIRGKVIGLRALSTTCGAHSTPRGGPRGRHVIYRVSPSLGGAFWGSFCAAAQ